MVKTEMIKVDAGDGGQFDAYLAVPDAGSGPGLIILQEIFGINDSLKDVARLFAEEGYVVLVPDLFWRLEPNVDLGYSEAEVQKAFDLYTRFDPQKSLEDIDAARDALAKHPACSGGAAVLGFCLGGTLALLTAARPGYAAAVAYYPVGVQGMDGVAPAVACPTIVHLGEDDDLCPPEAQEQLAAAFAENPLIEMFAYPGAGHAFYNSHRPDFRRHASQISHSRTLTLLRRALGPGYDLSRLWDQHAYYEFVTRNADDTIATMVDEPYVNHVPTMTGGVGRDELYHFYKNYFVEVNDENLVFIPVSRTVGVDRVVDEMVAHFHHTRQIDYLLPGVPPTGREVKLPMVAVVAFRGGKLYHEHIYWDQASLLLQVGLLERGDLPISGMEQAEKVLDEASVPSNAMMPTWVPPR